MAGKVAPNYSACTAAGPEGSRNNQSCRWFMDICASTPKSPYVLITDQGDVTALTRDWCMLNAVTLGRQGRISLQITNIPQPAGNGPGSTSQSSTTSSRKTPAPQPHVPPANRALATSSTSSSSAPTPGPAHQQQPPADAIPPPSPPAQDPTAFFASCATAGPEGSLKNAVCRAFVTSCTQDTTSRYELATDHGKYRAPDLASCVRLSVSLSQQGFLPLEGHIPTTATVPATPEPVHQVQTRDPLRHVKSFADLNLRLRVTGQQFTEDRRTLLFDTAAGIPLRLRYAVSSLGNGRYRMQYAVYVQEETSPLGGEQMLDFTATNGQVHLGFELRLQREKNFRSIRSIRVINLA